MNKLNLYRFLIPVASAVWGSGNRKAACNGVKKVRKPASSKTLVSLQACSLVSPPKV
jgi:hypothetical protein